MSRSLIIFGQGAIRCHPYVFSEIESIRNNDLHAFDGAIWGHFGFILSNLIKSIVFAFTDARLTSAPRDATRRYYQIIHRYSSNLAFLADFSMIMLGGELKRKEKLSARLGDILSYLYLASAVLKRFHQEGEIMSDLPLVDWSCQQLLHECELAFQGVIANFPSKWARVALKMILQPWGSQRPKPSDSLGHKLSILLTEPNDTRSRLSRLTFCEAIENCPVGKLEDAFHKICAVEELEKRVQRAVKGGILLSLTLLEQINEATTHGVLSKEEAQRLREAELARQQVIAVDDFDTNELSRHVDVLGVRSQKKIKNQDDLSIEVN